MICPFTQQLPCLIPEAHIADLQNCHVSSKWSVDRGIQIVSFEAVLVCFHVCLRAQIKATSTCLASRVPQIRLDMEAWVVQRVCTA